MASSKSRTLLLDVNTLVALAWPNHQFHRAVTARLHTNSALRWATCALTQLGFVRLSSNPAVVEVRKTPHQAVSVLAQLIADPGHLYIDSTPPLPDVERYFRPLLGHQQVTDAYLLALAISNDAVLLTLDRRLVPPARARSHLEVIAPANSRSQP
ncbi:MAG TPA: VapC toxin family PIN domain ribonuclease [Acidobacteria bacterium]|nr:VapC toxin family PIN domain ribonuclease [Acidobacteriota bacterium]